MRSRAPTLNQVAALAGVSHQTVSRVLNHHANVSANTRARVLAAIHQLDYQPNTAARTLVTDRSQTIGLITFDGSTATRQQFQRLKERRMSHPTRVSAPVDLTDVPGGRPVPAATALDLGAWHVRILSTENERQR